MGFADTSIARYDPQQGIAFTGAGYNALVKRIAISGLPWGQGYQLYSRQYAAPFSGMTTYQGSSVPFQGVGGAGLGGIPLALLVLVVIVVGVVMLR